MRAGYCPKCGTDAVRRSAGPRPAGWDFATPTGLTTAGGSAAVPGGPAPFGPVPVARYDCDVCGHAEEWIESAADLDLIRALAGGPPARPRPAPKRT